MNIGGNVALHDSAKPFLEQKARLEKNYVNLGSYDVKQCVTVIERNIKKKKRTLKVVTKRWKRSGFLKVCDPEWMQPVRECFSRWWFQIFVIFTPTWGNYQFRRAYFSNGLVQPPTSIVYMWLNLWNLSCQANQIKDAVLVRADLQLNHQQYRVQKSC